VAAGGREGPTGGGKLAGSSHLATE